jgi:SAM-dependent methyltransferase
VPAFAPALEWLLRRLTAARIIVSDHEGYVARYRLSAPLPAPALDVLREAVLREDEGYASTFALLDEAAAVYPQVARGETTGEHALFRRVALWCAYFSNGNPYYALNNRLAAEAAAARLPATRAVVLELGGGGGSATEAMLTRLRAAGRLGDLAAYWFTEPVPFFRRRAERALAEGWSGVPVRIGGLDLNTPWDAQGVPPASVDLVWAVNVFHLAHDLEAALREAFTALAPGGWLVLGEGIRPFPGQVVGAEFPFQLLRSFVEVETDPERRPTHGFLTPDQWIAALARGGFAPVEMHPDLLRIREIFPGFFAGVVCGRRPPA